MNLEQVEHSRFWLTLGWTMLHFLWIGSVLGLFIGLARYLMRHASASRRYLVTLFGFVILALVPVILFRAVWSRSELPPELTPRSDLFSIAAEMESRIGSWSHLASGTAPSTPTVDTVARILPWLWFVGSPLVTMWVATGLLGLRRWRKQRRSRTAPSFLTHKLQQLTEHLGLVTKVSIRLSEKIASPVLIGIVRPCILLPAALVNGLSEEQLEMVLLHELAHLRRWDNLALLLQRVVECCLFFHPVVWLCSRWLQLDRELCCDQQVIQHTARPQAYAQTLWSLAARKQSALHCSSGMAGGSLRQRIQQILSSEEVSMSRSRSLSTLLVLCSVLVVAGAAVPFAAQQSQVPGPANGKLHIFLPQDEVPGTWNSQFHPPYHASLMTGMAAQQCTDCHVVNDDLHSTVLGIPSGQATSCTACHVSESETYLVQPGDTLGKIARQHLGHERFWRRLLEQNPQMGDSTNLRVGQEIKLPCRQLLLPHDPAAPGDSGHDPYHPGAPNTAQNSPFLPSAPSATGYDSSQPGAPSTTQDRPLRPGSPNAKGYNSFRPVAPNTTQNSPFLPGAPNSTGWRQPAEDRSSLLHRTQALMDALEEVDLKAMSELERDAIERALRDALQKLEGKQNSRQVLRYPGRPSPPKSNVATGNKTSYGISTRWQ